MFDPKQALLNDKEVAQAISLSASWVRKQRFLRKLGHPHALTVDPIMIGKSPRYEREAIESWITNLKETKNALPELN